MAAAKPFNSLPRAAAAQHSLFPILPSNWPHSPNHAEVIQQLQDFSKTLKRPVKDANTPPSEWRLIIPSLLIKEVHQKWGERYLSYSLIIIIGARLLLGTLFPNIFVHL